MHMVAVLTLKNYTQSTSSENLFGKNTFSGHKFSVNTIITTINL